MFSTRVDVCRYELRALDGILMQKRCTILTNDDKFHRVFNGKICTRDHVHTECRGDNAKVSAYYPVKLCRSFARLWRKLDSEAFEHMMNTLTTCIEREPTDQELFPVPVAEDPPSADALNLEAQNC